MEADYLENTAVIDESNLTAEQQLGLKQAEERLERDYISRLEKVGWSDKKENGCLLSLSSPYFWLGGISTRACCLCLFLFYNEILEWCKILSLVVD